MTTKRKAGEVSPRRLAIYDERGKLKGSVGPQATAVTVSRFTGKPGARLSKDAKGRPCWQQPK